MPHEFEEHLLSAYLDDELSAEERALVEERLKSDAAARQLLDDLKRVRSLVATLPRWQGGDGKTAIPSGQMPVKVIEPSAAEKPPTEASLADTPSDAASLVMAQQVDFSATSLAESRLRRSDHISTVRTRRSMRWTTLVAVAAGLATLMLAAPYLFRSRGAQSEVAQHTDFDRVPAATETSPAEPEAATPTPTTSQQLGPKAAKEPMAELAEQNVPLFQDSFSREQTRGGGAPADEARLARGAAPSRANSESAELVPGPAEREQQASAADLRGRRASGQAVQEGGARGLGGAAAPAGSAPNATRASAAPATAPTAAAAAGEAGLALGLERSSDQPGQEIHNFGNLAAGGAAGTPQPPAALEPLPRFDSARSMRAAEGSIAPNQEAAANTAAAPFVAARSDAWTQDEVDAAMNRVWYFVAPGAPALGTVAQQGVAQSSAPRFSGGTVGNYDFASPAGQAGAAPNANLAYDSKPADANAFAEGVQADRSSLDHFDMKPNALSKAASRATVPANDALAAGSGARPSASAGGAIASAAAVGLARLPSGQSAGQWLRRLEGESSLQPVQPLFESESVAAKLSERDAAAKAGEQDKATPAQTVVLFVTASEARQILQSLERENREAAQAQPQGQQESKDRFEAALTKPEAAGSAAVEELQAWWTRPQARFNQSAEASKARGDEKVILILSQLPRG